jgi:uncharacterized protein (TIGR04222 family)
MINLLLLNPLDLPGPEFLVFYGVLAAVALTALLLLRWTSERGPAVVLTDPYEIAYLRAGWPEAVRLALASLVERGLLRPETYALAEGVTPEQGASGLERRLLERITERVTPQRLIDDLPLQGVTEEIRDSLERQALLPDAGVTRKRRRRLAIALVVLLGTAALKTLVALSRGHTNLGFLLILAVVATIAAVSLASPRRTARGEVALQDMGGLLGHLRERHGRLAANEAALVGATFGLAAVAGPGWQEISQLKETRTARGSTSGCGAADGGGGSGCDGGGGCGGGCGGCGS